MYREVVHQGLDDLLAVPHRILQERRDVEVLHDVQQGRLQVGQVERGRVVQQLLDGLDGVGYGAARRRRVDHRRRRRGLRRGGHRRGGDCLIGRHRGGRLNPHPHIVGFVDRDRNRIETKEIRRQQNPVNNVVGGQLRHGRHGHQRGGVGRGRGLLTDPGCRAVGAGLHQPGQIRHVRGRIGLRARSLPPTGLHRRQHGGEFVSRRGVYGT